MYSAERIGIEEFPRGPVDFDDFGRSCLVRHDGKEWGMGTFYACFNVTRDDVDHDPSVIGAINSGFIFFNQ